MAVLSTVEQATDILESQVCPGLDEVLLACELPRSIRRDLERVRGILEDIIYTLEHEDLEQIA